MCHKSKQNCWLGFGSENEEAVTDLSYFRYAPYKLQYILNAPRNVIMGMTKILLIMIMVNLMTYQKSIFNSFLQNHLLTSMRIARNYCPVAIPLFTFGVRSLYRKSTVTLRTRSHAPHTHILYTPNRAHNSPTPPSNFLNWKRPVTN